MPRSSLWLQSLVLASVGVLASWAGNNLPTLDDLNLPQPWWVILAMAVGTSLVLNLLPSLWGEPTATDQQTISRGWSSCLFPLLASGVLFFLVRAGHIPPQMVATCLYASLALFFCAAILPPLLVWNTQRVAGADPLGARVDAPSDADARNRSDLLKAVNIEVEGRLKSAFHNRVRLILGKESYPAEVQRPWDQEVKDRNEMPIAIDPGTSILSIFERPDVAGGKLLILGNPGSGKTTTLLELAKALTSHAQDNPDAPVPVVLGLSTWQGSKQKFSTWLLSQLKLKYAVREAIGQRWLESGKILPLLDGLDEVAPESQIACVKAINQLRQDFEINQIVVCSRIKEYKQLQIQLQLNAAVYLQPLKPQQIREYCLRTVGVDLWNMVQSDSHLLDLVKTPFFMGIVSVVWRTISQTDWQQAQSAGKQRQLLLDAYIQQRLGRTDAQQARRVKRWLAWLATGLEQHSQDEFLIENLQPSWLTQRWLEWSYRIVFGLVFGLLGGLIFGLNRGLVFGLFGGLIWGLIFGLSNISLQESVMKWSWEEAGSGLIWGLIWGLIGGLIFGLLGGLSRGLLGGLIFGLIGGLSGAKIEIRTIPNQGIKASKVNALIFGLIFGLLGGLIGELVFGLLGGLIFGLIGGLLGGLLGGGIGVIQHFVLRLFLCSKGYAPWDYTKFLNDATDDLILLQRVGGGYRFIHALLRDRFAELWKEEFGTYESRSPRAS